MTIHNDLDVDVVKLVEVGECIFRGDQLAPIITHVAVERVGEEIAWQSIMFVLPASCPSFYEHLSFEGIRSSGSAFQMQYRTGITSSDCFMSSAISVNSCGFGFIQSLYRISK